MKLLTNFFFLLAFLCWSCQPASNGSSTEDTTNTGPWLSLQPDASLAKSKNIVLIAGDEEYRSEEALPQLAKILSKHHGFHCTVLFPQDTAKPGIINPNHLANIPGLENLAAADLMVIFTRFRALPAEQMAMVETFLKNGKPVIGIRTATHAFHFKDSTHQFFHYGNSYKGEKQEWHGGFGKLVLGENWVAHHGHHKHQSTKGLIAPGAENHPITKGLQNGDIWGPTDVYRVNLPLSGDGQAIILGQVLERKGDFDETDRLFGLKPTDDVPATTNTGSKEVYNPNEPMMPIAWARSYQLPGGETGKSFTTTIGSSTDLLNEGVRRLLVNAVYWGLELPVPEKAVIDIVGTYEPTAYEFRKDEYWVAKSPAIDSLR